MAEYINMARSKAFLTREETGNEPLGSAHSRGGRQPETASYRKEKQKNDVKVVQAMVEATEGHELPEALEEVEGPEAAETPEPPEMKKSNKKTRLLICPSRLPAGRARRRSAIIPELAARHCIDCRDGIYSVSKIVVANSINKGNVFPLLIKDGLEMEFRNGTETEYK
ncbi:hypothetical protein Syun_006454 [Stephania yunnanensis]|uniref:Uncharacterized protein n=1 Tax=Stephania yunnanensis TaxID=152371 RepID=A0AAP0KY30_9MAGN